MGYVSLTGNPITFTANRQNTITSLILQGKTNQPGTGDPSTTNIRPLYGVGQFDGKTVLNGQQARLQYNTTINAALIGGYSDVAPPSDNNATAIMLSNYLPVKSASAINGGEIGVGINTTGVIYLRIAGLKSTDEYNQYLAAHPLNLWYKSTAYPTATQVYIGFSLTDANGYHGYAAGPTAPLYEGDVLTWSGGSTVEVTRSKKLLYPENFIGGWGIGTDYPICSYSHSQYPALISPIINNAGFLYSSPGLKNQMWHQSATQVGIAINKSILTPHGYIGTSETLLSSMSAWCLDLKSKGTPLQILIDLATPTTETVPISEPITNAAGTVTLSAENTLDVVYVQFETSNNKYQDIQGADSMIYIQFIQAWKTGDYATAFGIIANNPQLNTKSFVADVINTLSTNLINLQNMNDPTFKADRIQTSSTSPVDLQVGQVYFKTL